MEQFLTALLWFGLSLPLVLLTQRWIHRHLHGVALLLTGKPGTALLVYSLVLFPGVLLHELSHWVAAKLVGVRTAGMSLLPKMGKDGSVQLGYVEYYKTPDVGAVRESFIGGAPLLTGAAAILIIAYNVFNLSNLIALSSGSDFPTFLLNLQALVRTGDFLLWLYLFFAISNAMMPSASDRRAWPTFFLLLAVMVGLIYLLGFFEVMVGRLLPYAAAFFSYLALAFTLTVIVNLMVSVIIASLEWFLGTVRGQRLNYGRRGRG